MSEYMTVAEAEQWNSEYNEAYTEYKKRAGHSSTKNLWTARTELRLDLQSDPQNAYASGALAAVTDDLWRRRAL